MRPSSSLWLWFSLDLTEYASFNLSSARMSSFVSCL